MSPYRDRIHNPGMYPDPELNLRPIGLWANIQPTPARALYFIFHQQRWQSGGMDCGSAPQKGPNGHKVCLRSPAPGMFRSDWLHKGNLPRPLGTRMSVFAPVWDYQKGGRPLNKLTGKFGHSLTQPGQSSGSEVEVCSQDKKVRNSSRP